MKTYIRLALFVFILTTIFLSACAPIVGRVFSTVNASLGAQDAAQSPQEAAPQKDVRTDNNSVAAGQSSGQDAAAPQATAAPSDPSTLPDGSPQTGHMIIKNADVKLQVESTDTAIDRLTQLVGDLGGYIVSSRVWYQDYSGTNYKYATISMGVPVDQFETAMRRIRGLALRVLDENASGQDVTTEFVDLQSQLGNLEATRDRIRSFLDDAKTVEESLRINQELSTIEDQIDKVKGRMNYLTGRSSYSTITVNLEPNLPVLTPTPTPTLRPTATPTVWNPGTTFEGAKQTVTVAYQGIIELLIGFFVVIVPILAPPALIVWLVWKFFTRKKKA